MDIGPGDLTTMNIFVLNCGSSSLKYGMISMPAGEEILSGEVQRIGAKTAEASRIVHRVSGREETYPIKAGSYKEAFSEATRIVEKDMSFPPDVFAHRLVQGGAEFRDNTLITRREFPLLEKIRDLAPIHNPPVIELINECDARYPEIPQAVILDTAFHSTIPEYAYTYPLPEGIRDELGIRKYGFHGISHQYVSEAAAEFLGIAPERFNAVSCHLGSGGASLCVVAGGKSADNSMGFSPLQGLVMSTRCGDLDPAVVLKMIAYTGGDYSKVDKILNRKSGVLGLSGISSDIRDVIRRAAGTEDERSRTTLDVYLSRIKKYLGAYMTVVGNADAVIFTDTIGESVPYVRELVCRNMDYFGIRLDKWKNRTATGLPADISSSGSEAHILVVRTNEEAAIAKRAYELLSRRETYGHISPADVGLVGPDGSESAFHENGEGANEKLSRLDS